MVRGVLKSSVRTSFTTRHMYSQSILGQRGAFGDLLQSLCRCLCSKHRISPRTHAGSQPPLHTQCQINVLTTSLQAWLLVKLFHFAQRDKGAICPETEMTLPWPSPCRSVWVGAVWIRKGRLSCRSLTWQSSYSPWGVDRKDRPI